jgi:hypothetical protein
MLFIDTFGVAMQVSYEERLETFLSQVVCLARLNNLITQ